MFNFNNIFAAIFTILAILSGVTSFIHYPNNMPDVYSRIGITVVLVLIALFLWVEVKDEDIYYKQIRRKY